MALLRRIAAERGLTLLFTEHDMDVVFSTAQRIAVLHQGRIIAEGTPDDDPRATGSAPHLSRGAPVSAVLEVDAIDTYYGLSRALFGVSLTVERGQCVCLLGRNGVGKTTVMRSIMGLTPPAQGASLEGRCASRGWRTDRIVRAGIGFVPEDRRVFAELTVHENLDVARRAAGGAAAGRSTRCAQLFPKLAQLRDRRAGTLSGGEQQMLTIARTLMGNPELLLLDEPSEGLAPLVVESLLEQVQQAQGARDSRSCSPSRASSSRWRSPIASTCSRRARSSTRDRPPRCATTRRCAIDCSRSVNPYEENAMPYVTIRILKGHSQQRKDEIARRVTDAVSEVDAAAARKRSGSCSRTRLPTTGMSAARPSASLKKAGEAAMTRRDPRPALRRHRRRRACAYERLAGGFLFTEGPLWDARDQRLLFSDIPATRSANGAATAA